MKKFVLLICLLGLIFANGGLVLAEEEKKGAEVIRLEEIVVTATKTPKKLENVQATVTIIGPEEIEAMSARTVDDLLADLPGIQAYEPQGVGVVTPQKVRMRGIGFAGHTMIMLDGQPMNNSFTDFGLPYPDSSQGCGACRGHQRTFLGPVRVLCQWGGVSISLPGMAAKNPTWRFLDRRETSTDLTTGLMEGSSMTIIPWVCSMTTKR